MEDRHEQELELGSRAEVVEIGRGYAAARARVSSCGDGMVELAEEECSLAALGHSPVLTSTPSSDYVGHYARIIIKIERFRNKVPHA